eukprot:s725_g8.t1
MMVEPLPPAPRWCSYELRAVFARIPSPLPVSALREGSDAQGWWQILAETRAQRRELEHRGELALAAQEVA